MKLIFFLCFLPFGTVAQEINLLPGEEWFGAAVNEGENMPFTNGYHLNLYGDNRGNQTSPLLLSTMGRFVWSEEAFEFAFKNNRLVLSNSKGTIVFDSAGRSLSAAFASASKRFFAPSGKLPDTLLFARPQYNTWIELTYNQNQADILKYAHSIIDNGFPPGVLMIDDNWADYYGKFSFRKDRFPAPLEMTNELHKLGFKVMLWVCPFVSPDTEIFRELMEKKYLLHDGINNKNPAIINWWNGYSAVFDFTNPDAVTWYHNQLDSMVTKYGIDGFKFDAGDMEYYPSNSISTKKATPNEHCELWGTFGLYYPLNEYRAMWKRGGQPLVQRLRDKRHNWEDLQKLIPDVIVSGLIGYPFSCPDMIGGGEAGSFNDTTILDQELIVRSAQTSALMPMMQFSVAPWRVLDKQNMAAVKKAVDTRMKFTPYIMQLFKSAAKTGEPIVKSLEFSFPHQDFARIKDQFMLGDRYMIAPMTAKGNKRIVKFPKGIWKGDDGTHITGPVAREINVPTDRLPIYELIKKSGKSQKKRAIDTDGSHNSTLLLKQNKTGLQ
jgi:alpha-glucosidase (family GH31 glycosyl hydrolase)